MAKKTIKSLKEQALKTIDKKYIVFDQESFKENCFVKDEFEKVFSEAEEAKKNKIELAEKIITEFMKGR